MILALKAISWLWGIVSTPLAWFMAGRYSKRASVAEKALSESNKARRIDDEVAGLDEHALDDRLRDLRQ